MVEKIEKVKDHFGTEFESIREMCDVWGQDYNEYLRLRNKGYTKKEALTYKNKVIVKTTPTRLIGEPKKCKDHNGREFNSIKEKCEYHGVAPSTYTSRIKAGKSEEEAQQTKQRKENY